MWDDVFARDAITSRFASRHSGHQGTVPLQMGINQLFVVGGAPIPLGSLLRYYPVKPEGVANRVSSCA